MYTHILCWCLVAQSCQTLCDPLDYNPPGSSVHGIFQARMMVNISSSRGSSLCLLCLLHCRQILYPIPTSQVIRGHQVKLPASNSTFPLAMHFTYSNVFVSMLLSQLVSPSPSPAVSTSLFRDLPVALLTPYK